MLQELSTKQKVILSIIILIIVGTIGFYTYTKIYKEENVSVESSSEELKVEDENKNETKDENTSTLKSNKEENNITVHIIGEVKKRGVYTLKKGSRIVDVIKLAGGETDKADTTKVNLAFVVEDGVQIYIPNKTENKDNVEYVKEDSGENIIKEMKTETTQNKDTKVNINTATQAELEKLPGIGPAIATKILEHRKQVGKFNKIEEIKNVNGLGDSKYNDIKEKIKV